MKKIILSLILLIATIGNSQTLLKLKQLERAATSGSIIVSGPGGVATWSAVPISPTVTDLDPVISQTNTPPGTPSTGDRHLVGTSPTGVFVGSANKVAEWDGASWIYTTPVTDDVVYITSTLTTLRYDGSGWVAYTGTAVLQNGNTVGTSLNIGTNNPKALTFKTNNIESARVVSGGSWGFGTITPSAKATFKGTTSDATNYASDWRNSSNVLLGGFRNDSRFEVNPIDAPFGASFKVLTDGRIESFIEGSIVSAENISFGRNTGIGQGDNMNFGINAGANQSTLTANGNNNFGYSAGALSTSAGSCVNIGKTAGFSNLISSYNVCVGDRAGYGNLGEENVFIGTQSGFGSGSQNGPYNVAIGKASMLNHGNSTGGTAIGYNALALNVSGHYNSVFGYSSGLFTTGGNNAFFAKESGYNNTTGTYNSNFGTNSGYTNSTGDNNVNLGAFSGYYYTGSNKLFIDNQSRGSAGNELTKSLIVGTFDANPDNQKLTINAIFNIPVLSTPASPVTGDIYNDGTHIYCYLSGSWKQLDN